MSEIDSNVDNINENNKPQKQRTYKQVLEFMNKNNRHAMIVTLPSITIDIIFVFFNFYIGLISANLWYVMLSFYYLLLLFFRVKIVLRVGRAMISKKMNKLLVRNHRRFGFELFMMDVVMAAAMYFMLKSRIAKPFNALLIIPVAIYTLYKVIIAIRNLIKAHASKSLFVIELRKLSQADAMVSVLMLESALVNKFGDLQNEFYYRLCLISGAVVCLIIAALAVTSLFVRNPQPLLKDN